MSETLEEVAEQFEYTNGIYGFKQGVKWQQERSYSEEDMINASKYGYNFHKTTFFPNQKFEDSCVNNTKQWLTTFKKK